MKLADGVSFQESVGRLNSKGHPCPGRHDVIGGLVIEDCKLGVFFNEHGELESLKLDGEDDLSNNVPRLNNK